MIRNFIREVFHSEQWKEYSKTTPVHVDDEKPHAQKQMRIILDSLTDENVTQLRKDCIDAFPHNRNINNYVNSLKYKDGFSDTEISLLAHLVWLRNYDAQEGAYMNTIIGLVNRGADTGWCILKIESLYNKRKEELLTK